MKSRMKIKPKTYWSGAAFFAVLAAGFPALAEDASVGDTVIHLAYSIDTFYFLMSGALVMWMAAGFAMLEAGLVRGKNTVEILTKNVALYSIACIMYMVVGYNLMYGGGNGVIPTLSFFLGPDNSVADVLASGGDTYYSGMSDFFFQVVFVATAMSIVSGAVAERMKLWAFLIFAIIMTGFIYPVQGYWKWGGGFLDGLGFLDFAGSGVVHLCGATAAVAGVLLLGPRAGKYVKGRINAIPGANLPLATLGTFILWLGWFGFNGGSELKISNIEEANAVSMIFVNTNTAAAGGLVAALLFSRAWFGKADLTMALNGALAGLVAITAEPLTPSPLLATVVGAIGGLIVVASIVFIDKAKIDDPVGAISVHGVVGIWGLIAVAFTNPDGSIVAQLIGIAVIFAWVFGTSFVAWLIIKAVMGIRVSEEEELEGCDISECGLDAYPEFTKD
ncbi:MAG: ammonium transporter [Desulfocapsaceae bacterium]|nr:ammonium transporter [Desulfocapsaceae bacterium]